MQGTPSSGCADRLIGLSGSDCFLGMICFFWHCFLASADGPDAGLAALHAFCQIFRLQSCQVQESLSFMHVPDCFKGTVRIIWQPVVGTLLGVISVTLG